MKTTMRLSILVALASLSSCKDQIDTPTTGSASERILFTTVDYTAPNPPHAISFDSSAADRKDLGMGFIYSAGGGKILWNAADFTKSDIPQLTISDNVGGNRVSLQQLISSKEEFYGYGYALSPDGTHVSYTTRDTTDNSYHLYVASSDGTGARELSNAYDHQTTVCFSPDGNKIAYYRDFDDQHQLKHTLEISTIDGSSRYPLSGINSSSVDGTATISWSKKDKIAYYDKDTIFVVSSDGSGKVSLGHSVLPCWSPTGDTLAYVGASSDIYLTSDNGATITNLTNSPGVFEGYPSWSADGKRILVTRWIGDLDNTLMSLEEFNLTSGTNKVIASPGAYGYYVK